MATVPRMPLPPTSSVPRKYASYAAAAAAGCKRGASRVVGASRSAHADGAALPEWPSLAALQPGDTGGSRVLWYRAVAPAVTALGRIVAPFIDVMATRVSPDHDAIVEKLRALGRGEAVAGFQAAWELLGSTPDGRAVIAVCRTAAEGGALLGRQFMTGMAKEITPELVLASMYAGKEYLPVLQAAARYYRGHTGTPAASTTAASEWPSLASLASVSRDLTWNSPEEVPEEWKMAVAPAVTVMGHIVARYIPDLGRMGVFLSVDSVVGMLQHLGRDEDVPRFLAAWEELGSTPDGRAVIAVCRAAVDVHSMPLGNSRMEELAGDPGLEGKLAKVYTGCDFLPVLLAAARYYRAYDLAAGGGGAAAASRAAASRAAAAARDAEAASRAAAVISRRLAAGGTGAAAGGAGGGTWW